RKDVEKLEEENRGDEIAGQRQGARLPGGQREQRGGNQPETDAFGDAEGEGNGHDDQHRGSRDAKIRQVDLRHRLQHEDADNDERGGRGGGGNCQDQGRQEQREQHQQGGGDGGQAGAPARLHARGGFDVADDGGGAEEGAEDRGRRVGD